MNYKELEQILTPRQIEAVDYILNNRHYDIWVYTVLYQISGKTIKDIAYKKASKDNSTNYFVPKIVRCICPYCKGTEDRDVEKEWLIEFKLLVTRLCCRRCGINTKFYLIAINPIEEKNSKKKIFTNCYVAPYTDNESVGPEEVEEDLRTDYREAYLCLDISPRASVALSRRCLQHLIKLKTDIKETDLYNAIEKLLKLNILPSDISDQLHAIRNIGNFAVHPLTYNKTNEIVQVTKDEAEWTLNIIKQLFDFFYVAPKRKKKRKEEFNEKLRKAGKEELK